MITVTSTGNSGPGTLRAAILQANMDATDDTITFAPSVTGIITLATALPNLSADMDIEGPGPSALTVARSSATGTPAFDIFGVTAGVRVTISGLAITGGNHTAFGGGGGGISNSGTLTLTDTTITGNSSGSYADGDTAGGIFNSGTMSIANSTINGNSANAGYSDSTAGGIDNSGTMSVIGSTISDNSASETFTQAGGGIENLGTMSIVGSAIDNNSAVEFKGGGDGGGIGSDGNLAIVNSTISGNDAPGLVASHNGNAIYNSGPLSLTYTTITNVAPTSTGTNPAVYLGPTAVEAVDTIFDASGGQSVYSYSGASFSSLGHNLFSDAPGFALTSSDLINTNPLLAPLANNGGPTLTQALLPGSPAIAAGAALPGITTDQRGVPRPSSAPDIGAFQAQQPPSVVAVERHGVHYQRTTLVVTFSMPMDSTRAASLVEYRLVSAGPDHRFGTRGDWVIRIRSVQYDATSHTVTLEPIRRLPLHSTFQLTIVGTPPNGLTSESGVYLDGTKTGQPGSNYVTFIDDKLLVPPYERAERK